jgi:hypothetical protein
VIAGTGDASIDHNAKLGLDLSKIAKPRRVVILLRLIPFENKKDAHRRNL